MGRESSEYVEIDGWLSLHGGPGLARLTKGELSARALRLYVLNVPVARALRPPARPTSTLLHTSATSPHPAISSHPPSPEAVAHNLLFSTLLPPTNYKAEVLTVDCAVLLAKTRAYLELIPSLSPAPPRADLLRRAAVLVESVLAFTSLLSDAVVAELLALCGVLPSLDPAGSASLSESTTGEATKNVTPSLAPRTPQVGTPLQPQSTPQTTPSTTGALQIALTSALPSVLPQSPSTIPSVSPTASVRLESPPNNPDSTPNPKESPTFSPLFPSSPNFAGESAAQVAAQLTTLVRSTVEHAAAAWRQALASTGARSQYDHALEELSTPLSTLPQQLLSSPEFVSVFVDQLALFHRQLWATWSPLNDPALLFHRAYTCHAWKANPLVFDSDYPHFVATAAAASILEPGLDDAARSRSLAAWIRGAHRMHASGDIVGWSAIVQILFTPPLLRLDAWRLLDADLLARFAHEWSFKAFEMYKRAREPFLAKRSFRVDSEDVGKLYAKGHCVPYFGDAIVTEQLENISVEDTQTKLARIATRMEGWNAYFSKVEDEVQPETSPSSIASFQRLFARWARPGERPDLLTQSLLVRPRALGAYLPHFYTQPLPLTQGGLLPILFVDALPSFRLYPRATLLMVNQPKQSSRPKAALRRSSSFPPSAYPLTTGVSELDSGACDRLERAASAHVLARVVRDLLNVGTETIDTRADLVFKSFADDTSRSKRHSSSIVESFGTVADGQLVVVKSASLLRLVDVLVLGAGVFGSELRIDAQLHLATLLATFRTMCSPAEMLDMLHLRVRGARQVARQLATDSIPLQLWQVADPHLPADELAIRVVSVVMQMLQKWIAECFFDFQDDSGVLEQGRALLYTVLGEVSAHGYPEGLEARARQLLHAFARSQFSVRVGPLPPSWHKLLARAEPPPVALAAPPTPRHDKPEDVRACNMFIDELNVIVQDAFSRIALTDWMRLLEALEVQTATPTGLFSYSPQSSEDVVVEDVYSWLSTLCAPAGAPIPGARVLDQLPEPITALIKLHFGLVAYFTRLIADPKTGTHARLARMVFLLKTLGALRARMRFFDLIPDEETSKRQHVPSFLERALAAAVLRPESRAFAALWLTAGQEIARYFPPEDESSFVPNAKIIFVPAVPTERGEPVVPCIGWIVERLLEIICCVPNTSVEHPHLINFDKRRFGFNLIQNICQEFQTATPITAPEQIITKYLCLFGEAAQTASVPTLFDRKALRESVQREGRARAKVFVDVVQQEAEKNALETRQFEKLEKQGPQKNTHTFYRSHGSESSTSLYSRRFSILGPPQNSDQISIADSTKLSSPGSSSSRRGSGTPKKSRFGGFLKAVRPLSVLGNSASSVHISSPSNMSSSPSQTGIAGLGDRGERHSQRPPGSLGSQTSQTLSDSQDAWEPDDSIVLDNLASRLDVIPDDLKLYTTVETENITSVEITEPGGTVLSITYRGQGPKPETLTLRASNADTAREWVAVAHRVVRAVHMGSTRVFGVELDVVCAREHSIVPHCLEALLTQVEERGLDEVGVYRISGSMASVNALKQLFDQGAAELSAEDPRWADINTVAGCIKLYLRELPQSILTPDLLPEFLECSSAQGVDVPRLQGVIAKLPVVNYAVLKRLVSHLKLVVDHSAVNKMNMQNIAIVFSINFLPPMAVSLMGSMQQIVSAMIIEKDSLFKK